MAEEIKQAWKVLMPQGNLREATKEEISEGIKFLNEYFKNDNLENTVQHGIIKIVNTTVCAIWAFTKDKFYHATNNGIQIILPYETIDKTLLTNENVEHVSGTTQWKFGWEARVAEEDVPHNPLSCHVQSIRLVLIVKDTVYGNPLLDEIQKVLNTKCFPYATSATSDKK